MATGSLEHLNITVSDTYKTADLLCKLFEWHIRWQGTSEDGGHTIHVGTDDTYLAVYSVGTPVDGSLEKYTQRGAMNHIGIVVDDLDTAEKRVVEAGYKPHAHMDYEPGRRFYFTATDNIEIEVVSYA